TAVARAEPGQYSTVPPGRYAGNLDIRDFTEGAALYVPVFVKGALLWTGDSHAAQGNGEINLTALETAYKEMSVTVEVLKNMKLEWPRIETRNSWITVGIDRDLNKALDILKNETTNFLMEQRKIGRDQAEKLMMAAWDCRVSQVVDVNKGLHCCRVKTARPPEPGAGGGSLGRRSGFGGRAGRGDDGGSRGACHGGRRRRRRGPDPRAAW